MSDKRYFHLSYDFRGGNGCKPIISHGMFNKKQQELLIESDYGVENVGVSTWVEMTRDDFFVFTAKDFKK